MAEPTWIDRLDEAVSALLARPDVASPPASDEELAPLLRLAVELRRLPVESFKTRLESDLRRRAEMASQAAVASKATPAVTPYLCVRDAAAAIEFYKRAFGAVESGRLVQPDGKIPHAQIQFGGATVMLADELPEYGFTSPQSLGGSPVKIYLYVDDVDAVVRQALAAGAQLVRPVKDEFHGERSGNVSDPFGYTWVVATRKEQLTMAEIERRFDTFMQGPNAPEKKPVKFREGFRTVTPYLAVHEAPALIDFVKQAFGAQELGRTGPGSGGGLHAEVRIGDSIVMIGGGGAFRGTPMPAALHLYVSDADATYRRALAAGATSFYEPTDMPYGDREGGVKDAFGNSWYIATHRATGHKPEGMGSVTPTLHPRGADSLMDFLKRALAAEETECTRTPEGVVMHAQLRIGDSVVELGEARGAIEPTVSMLYLYVDDADAWYRRAIAAGAESISEPADQPYGDRVAAVRDLQGNQWYFGTPKVLA
jgi:PhnB protein